MNPINAYYALRWQILKRDNFTCQYCGQNAPNVKLEIDHIIPRGDGGEDTPENLVTACYACNRGKSGLTIQQNRRGIKRPTKEKPDTRTTQLLKRMTGQFTISQVREAFNIGDKHARTIVSRAYRSGKLKRISEGLYECEQLKL